jgi:hypothetical protein
MGGQALPLTRRAMVPKRTFTAPPTDGDKNAATRRKAYNGCLAAGRIGVRHHIRPL